MCLIRTASNVCRLWERSQSPNNVCSLRKVAQLKLSCLQFITQFLNGVLSHQSSCSFTFCVNSISYFTSVLIVFCSYCINVSVSFAKCVIVQALYPILLIVSYEFRLYLHPISLIGVRHSCQDY